MATPFQCSAKVLHHWRSARNWQFSRIWWWPLVAPGICSRSIILRRNALPGFTTWQACCNVPTRDSNSRLRQVLRVDHRASASLTRTSFSAGRRSTPSSVSISMPKNVRHGDGPSILSAASGTPNSPHV